MPDRRANRILGPGSRSEATRIAEILRKETVGGALLLLGSIVALVWINSPTGHSYTALRNYTVGPEALHLHLSLGTWSADGLLAIFFFVVGLEFKREFVGGALLLAGTFIALVCANSPASRTSTRHESETVSGSANVTPGTLGRPGDALTR